MDYFKKLFLLSFLFFSLLSLGGLKGGQLGIVRFQPWKPGLEKEANSGLVLGKILWAGRVGGQGAIL